MIKSLLYKFSFGAMIISFSGWSSITLAQSIESVQVSRYQTISTQAQSEQVDLLSPVIQVHFLSEIKTIGDAVNHLLRYSGYALVDNKQQSQDLKNTLKKPLPLVDRDLGPVALRQALALLIGPAFDLVIDPLNRTINFQLKTEFSPIHA